MGKSSASSSSKNAIIAATSSTGSSKAKKPQRSPSPASSALSSLPPSDEEKDTQAAGPSKPVAAKKQQKRSSVGKSSKASTESRSASKNKSSTRQSQSKAKRPASPEPSVLEPAPKRARTSKASTSTSSESGTKSATRSAASSKGKKAVSKGSTSASSSRTAKRSATAKMSESVKGKSTAAVANKKSNKPAASKRGASLNDVGSGRKGNRNGEEEMMEDLSAYDDMEVDVEDEESDEGDNVSGSKEERPASGSAAATTSGDAEARIADRTDALQNALRMATGGAGSLSNAEAQALLRDARGLFDGLGMYGYGNPFGGNVGNKWKQVVKELQSPSGSARLAALNQAAEDLAISMEEQLIGFPTDAVVKELIAILDNKPTGANKSKNKVQVEVEEEDDDEDDDMDDLDEDAQLARVLAMSAPAGENGGHASEQDMQAQLLACRCLANLLEVSPGTSHTIVQHDAVRVLCSKLVTIEYIELAEQVLSTLEKLSGEMPSSIVREGGLQAMLQYLDFFSTHVQRTALKATANCCRSVNTEGFPKVQEILPILRGVLAYPDQKLVEQATLALIRCIESARYKPDWMERLLDTETALAVTNLLAPSAGSTLLSSAVYAHLLRALTSAARSSTKVCLSLYDAEIPASMYFILAGVLPSSHADPLDATGISAAIMQNMGERPKEQIEEALACICELLPPLSKEGVFDPRNYSEKMVGRYSKAKAKLEEEHPDGGFTSQMLDEAVQVGRRETAAATRDNAEAPTAGTSVPKTEGRNTSSILNGRPKSEETYQQKMELFNASSDKIAAFISSIMPTLVDVFSASAAARIRSRVLTALVKCLAYSSSEQLQASLKNVSFASFLSSIISSRDDPSFVLGALQMTEILLDKLPVIYRRSFRREGVFFEICKLADEELSSKKKPEAETSSKGATPQTRAEEILADPLASDLGDIVNRLEEVRNLVRGGGAAGSSSKRTSSVPSNPQDAVIVRARVVRIKKDLDSIQEATDFASTGVSIISDALAILKNPESDDCAGKALKDIAQLFLNQDEPLSSFELLQSGLLHGLMDYVSAQDQEGRRRKLMQALTETVDSFGVTALDVFIKRLQESLSRMETFEVETASSGLDDSRRSPLTNLVRQLRIRLKAEDPKDIPRVYQDMVVQVQAIAPVSAVSGYLRQKVANAGNVGARGGAGGALSSMFAALAGGEPPAAAKASSKSEAPPKAEEKDKLPRRRSSARLRGEPVDAESSAAGAAAPKVNADEDEDADEDGGAVVIGEMEGEFDEDEDFSDEEEIIYEGALEDDDDEEAEIDRPVEQTVDLSAPPDDSAKPQATTPQGTRVATPTPTGSAADQSRSNDLPPKLGSYAAAVKTAPSDWHFQFKVGDQVLHGYDTIYGALHRALRSEPSRAGGLERQNIWIMQPTIKFSKVQGPEPLPPCQPTEVVESDAADASALPPSLPAESPQAIVLRMLRVLHSAAKGADESMFINPKLTAKFIRQLEELVIVASDCLPDWAIDLPTHFPFLFPFEARYTFLQSTSFGYSRLIGKWLAQQNPNDNQRRSGILDTLPRPTRARVRIIRPKILESASRVMELYGPSAGILEIEYQDEPGTGLGPTLEFYTLVSKAFAERKLELWRDEDTSAQGDYVFHPHGLFPRPLSPDQPLQSPQKSEQPYFKTLGTFVGKALLDSRIIDLHFNPLLMSAMLGHKIPLTIDSLKTIDPILARNLGKLQQVVLEKKAIEEQDLSSEDRNRALSGLTLDGAFIEDLGLDFCVPGQHELELKPGGKDIHVELNNAQEYIDLALDFLLKKGVSRQIDAFRQGFSQIFPIADLDIFSPSELVLLFGNPEEDWSRETLEKAIKADHGYNSESKPVKHLIEAMTDFTKSERRAFLQFVTGAPKLPIGGFKGLHPQFTVVRKPHEPPYKADHYLPSVMTCAQYLKMPDYSSKEVLRAQIGKAMSEGAGAFMLS